MSYNDNNNSNSGGDRLESTQPRSRTCGTTNHANAVHPSGLLGGDSLSRSDNLDDITPSYGDNDTTSSTYGRGSNTAADYTASSNEAYWSRDNDLLAYNSGSANRTMDADTTTSSCGRGSNTADDYTSSGNADSYPGNTGTDKQTSGEAYRHNMDAANTKSQEDPYVAGAAAMSSSHAGNKIKPTKSSYSGGQPGASATEEFYGSVDGGTQGSSTVGKVGPGVGAGMGAGGAVEQDTYSGGSGDSKLGKLMQKAGNVLGNDKLAAKGEHKREEAGYEADEGVYGGRKGADEDQY